MKPLISLDIFDTAIFRKVYKPTDIFNVVEDKVGGNFKELRIKAQDKAAKSIPSYTILDIYKFLPNFNPREEIRAEYYNCKANPYILDMYNNGEAEYIFISDMYLPSDVLKTMLEHCGYEDPEVYVSCEHGACKGDGKLFKIVEEILGRKIDKHVGDNYTCDIEGSKKAKIPEQEFIGPAIYNREVITPELENKRLRKLLIDEELSDHDIAEKIGYLYAPLVYAFTKSVLDEARDDQTIFFNARDSFLMYVTARWILKTKKKIKYCRFSRKSCFLPNVMTNVSITDSANQSSLKFFKIQRLKTLRDFLQLYQIREDLDYNSFLRDEGLTIDSNIEFYPDRGKLVEKTLLFVQEEFYKKVIEAKEGFLNYLKKLGMKNNDIWVDLGYYGTMQAIIKRVSGIDLKGRYIGTIESESGVFHEVKFERKSFLPVGFICPFGGAVLEYIFSESKGTVTGYECSGKPILLKDLKYRKDITKRILKGALRGVQDISDFNLEISANDCFNVIKRHLGSPTFKEALFANQPIFENGSNEESVVWFNKDWIKKGKFKECYNRSYWKNAFKVLLKNDPEYKFLERFIK